MDILNWVYLLKNKLVKTTVQDPTQDLVILGNNVTFAKRGDKYQSYGMTVEDFAAYVASTTDTQMNYVTGILDPEAESDFIALPDTITTNGSNLYNTYKLGGIVNFNGIGVSSYSYLIGVISGDQTLELINDATVIGATTGVTTYGGVSGKFTVNALVKDASTGAAIPLTFATIVLDNTIAGLDDYFVSIVAVAGAPWVGTAFIDIEFMSNQVLSYFN
jgi:hypothetical protein